MAHAPKHILLVCLAALLTACESRAPAVDVCSLMAACPAEFSGTISLKHSFGRCAGFRACGNDVEVDDTASQVLMNAIIAALDRELIARGERATTDFEMIHASVLASGEGTMRLSELHGTWLRRRMQCSLHSVDDESLALLRVDHGDATDCGRTHRFSMRDGRITQLTTRAIRRPPARVPPQATAD